MMMMKSNVSSGSSLKSHEKKTSMMSAVSLKAAAYEKENNEKPEKWQQWHVMV